MHQTSTVVTRDMVSAPDHEHVFEHFRFDAWNMTYELRCRCGHPPLTSATTDRGAVA